MLLCDSDYCIYTWHLDHQELASDSIYDYKILNKLAPLTWEHYFKIYFSSPTSRTPQPSSQKPEECSVKIFNVIYKSFAGISYLFLFVLMIPCIHTTWAGTWCSLFPLQLFIARNSQVLEIWWRSRSTKQLTSLFQQSQTEIIELHFKMTERQVFFSDPKQRMVNMLVGWRLKSFMTHIYSPIIYCL